MLLEIREKSQGVFAWVILVLICVPFALWGIQNYVGGGSETAVATVGEKEFYQQDVNRAYSQYSQKLAGRNFNEQVIKKQALEKLIQDEVLFQHAESESLATSDASAKKFISELEYFQTEGKFDQSKFKSLLSAQRLSSDEFVARIKKALMMEQFQKAIVNSSFTTQSDIDGFFKIQNQTRDIELVSVALPKIEVEPTAEEIDTYYQANQTSFLTEEQVSIEYVELSIDELASKVTPTEDQLTDYYSEQKEQYTMKERRKISHILFSFKKGKEDDLQLERAKKAKADLQNKAFAALAKEVSDDKLTAEKGGDLGLFNVGDMEEALEEAATALALNEVSEPVKSGFGYHLIKVTELVEGGVKPFATVKAELTEAYKKSSVENTFYELGESMGEISYENPDSLQVVADELGLDVKKTGLFGRGAKPAADKLDVISNPAIVSAAFSEDVLKGNNSQPIELGSDKLFVLRMTEHKPADVKALDKVKPSIISILNRTKAKTIATEKAEAIKASVIAGKSIDDAAKAQGETAAVKKIKALARSSRDVSWPVSQAVFKAAKPSEGKPVILVVGEPSGTQVVVSLLAVAEGVMSDEDKTKMELAESNMTRAFGQSEFSSVLNNLRHAADVTVNMPVAAN